MANSKKNKAKHPTQTEYWKNLVTTDFVTFDPEQTIAMLPVGAIEQHGPHLPLGTDAYITESLVEGLLTRNHNQINLLALPPMLIGHSCEHGDFPGTLSADAETLINLWTNIGKQVSKSGIYKLLILNSHGGQPQVVDIVAQRLRSQNQMLVVGTNTFQLGMPSNLFNCKELQHGLHGGEIETSIMLHLHPDLVRMDKADNFIPASIRMEKTYSRLAPGGSAKFAWQAQDIHKSGAFGDATKADPERGSILIQYMLDEISLILKDMSEFPISDLKHV